MKLKCLVASACLLAAALAPARAHEFSEAYSLCIAKAGGATFAMQDCIAAELAVQDERLNAAYAATMNAKLVPEKRRAQLREVQRKWIAFRDANCAFYDDRSLGQAARLAANECVLTMTAARAAELESLKPE